MYVIKIYLEEIVLMRCFSFKTLVICFLLVLTGVSKGVGQQSTLGRIIGISVAGNNTSEASVIRLSSGLKEGQEVKWEEIQHAVKQLWALGIFSE
ncbi:hypothetical protein KA005_03985, partial [bacterium]|nr:hypothetical protein [bacterium]